MGRSDSGRRGRAEQARSAPRTEERQAFGLGGGAAQSIEQDLGRFVGQRSPPWLHAQRNGENVQDSMSISPTRRNYFVARNRPNHAKGGQRAMQAIKGIAKVTQLCTMPENPSGQAPLHYAKMGFRCKVR